MISLSLSSYQSRSRILDDLQRDNYMTRLCIIVFHAAVVSEHLMLAMGVFDWAVSWSTLKSWSTFRIRLVLHEISWSTKDVSRNSGDIFREVNHVMALLRQLRRCSSRQVLQILINSK